MTTATIEDAPPEAVEAEQPNAGEPAAEVLPGAVQTEAVEKVGSQKTTGAEYPAPLIKKPFDIVEGVENYIAKAIGDAENEEETITAKVMRQRNSVACLSIAMLRIDQGKKTIKERYEDAVELLDSMEKDAEREASESAFQPNLPFDEKPPAVTSIPRKPLDWTLDKYADGSAEWWEAVNTTGLISRVDECPAKFFIDKASETEFDVAMSHEELFGEPFDPIPSLSTLDEAQAFCQKRDDELYAIAHPGPTPTAEEIPAADDAWRKVQLHTLTPAIGRRTLKSLIAHSPEINSLGTLADWQENKGDFWATDIYGLGAKGKEEIENAQMAYWQTNPQAATKPQ